MLTFAAALGAALLSGTLVEWVWHRHVLHARGGYLAKRHRAHHREGTTDGLALEALALSPAALALGWVGLLWSFPAGLGWACGALAYVFLAAHAHRKAHQTGDPFHGMHHARWKWNYGIVTSLWDRVLGTYRERVS